MAVETVIGVSTVVVSLMIKLIGEPDQILRNYRRRSTSGISPLLYVLSLVVYILWVIHGLIRSDVYIVIAQSAGVLTSAIILAQMWIYRRKPASTGSDSQDVD